MRPIVVLLATASIGCAGGDASALIERASESFASAEFTPSLIDIGPSLPGRQLRGELTLRNCSNKPLQFRLVTSCGCTSAESRTGTIAPRASDFIHVYLRCHTSRAKESP